MPVIMAGLLIAAMADAIGHEAPGRWPRSNQASSVQRYGAPKTQASGTNPWVRPRAANACDSSSPARSGSSSQGHEFPARNYNPYAPDEVAGSGTSSSVQPPRQRARYQRTPADRFPGPGYTPYRGGSALPGARPARSGMDGRWLPGGHDLGDPRSRAYRHSRSYNYGWPSVLGYGPTGPSWVPAPGNDAAWPYPY